MGRLCRFVEDLELGIRRVRDRDANPIARALAPQREAVNALVRDENELVGQTVRMYLRDTYDHIVQTAEAVEANRELVNGLMNTYLSVVSNRMNEVMKTLTVFARPYDQSRSSSPSRAREQVVVRFHSPAR